MLNINCGSGYPGTAPDITFSSKVNLGCVDSTGRVNFGSMGAFSWSDAESMETALIGIYKEMQSSANKSKAQPADGEMY